MAGALDTNRRVWDRLYSTGRGTLDYPDEHLVRIVRRRLNPEVDRRILDLGFGSGNNLIHLIQAGFGCDGVEASPEALRLVERRLRRLNLSAPLRTLTDGLPYPDEFFDAVISWQVLYYNDEQGFQFWTEEIHRVMKPGGKMLATMARKNDVLVLSADPIDSHTYLVSDRYPSQAGVILFVPDDEDHLRRLFAQFHQLEIGYFEWSFDSLRSSHWIIWGEKGEWEKQG